MGRGLTIPSEIVGHSSDPAERAARLALEERSTFASHWVPVVRSSELLERGEFRALDLAGVSVAVVRQEKGGAAHGFVNACIHRGACILRTSEGRTEHIVCPYHGFRYDRTGALMTAPMGHTFPKDLGEARLKPVGTQEKYGWIWVRVDGEDTGLAAALGGDLIGELERWPLADWSVVNAQTSEHAFDWKIGIEAFLEPLHVPTIHARSAHPMVDVRNMAARRLGRHSRMALPFRSPKVFEPNGLIGSVAARAGVVPPASLLTVQRRAHFVYFVHPATVLMLFPTHGLFLRFLPAGVGRTQLSYELLAAPATDEASERWRRSLIPGYDTLLEEDLENLPWIERGLRSGRIESHALSALEIRIAWFRDALRADRQAVEDATSRREQSPGLDQCR